MIKHFIQDGGKLYIRGEKERERGQVGEEPQQAVQAYATTAKRHALPPRSQLDVITTGFGSNTPHYTRDDFPSQEARKAQLGTHLSRSTSHEAMQRAIVLSAHGGRGSLAPAPPRQPSSIAKYSTAVSAAHEAADQGEKPSRLADKYDASRFNARCSSFENKYRLLTQKADLGLAAGGPTATGKAAGGMQFRSSFAQKMAAQLQANAGIAQTKPGADQLKYSGGQSAGHAKFAGANFDFSADNARTFEQPSKEPTRFESRLEEQFARSAVPERRPGREDGHDEYRRRATTSDSFEHEHEQRPSSQPPRNSRSAQHHSLTKDEKLSVLQRQYMKKTRELSEKGAEQDQAQMTARVQTEEQLQAQDPAACRESGRRARRGGHQAKISLANL